MKWYDEEVAHNLLWMKPGVKFWYRQTAVGPIAVAEILEVNAKREYVLCTHDIGASLYTPGTSFRLALNEPKHMSTYPGDGNRHFTWPRTDQNSNHEE